jgi:uncharacterized protein
MDSTIALIDHGAFLKKEKVLVIADIHVGYEEALNKQGVLIPRFQMADVTAVLERLMRLAPQTVVIDGDLKHEFGDISEQEWRDTLKIVDSLTRKAKIVLVKGNHDTILGPIAKKRGIEIVSHYSIGSYYICHGHEIPSDAEFKAAKTVIIGHEHPSVTLKKDARTETYKCYLVGKYQKKDLIVLPSLNFVTEGTDILKESLLSPFLSDIARFKVLIVDDKVYDFGLVRNLR